MTDVRTKLSTLTNLPQKYVDMLINDVGYIITDSIQDSNLMNETITEIDIGIGTLVIGTDNNELKYKFIPSKTLDNSIKTTIKSGNSPIVQLVNKAAVNRIVEMYEDLF